MILGRCPCGQAKVLASWFSRLSDRYFFPSEAIKTIRRAKKKILRSRIAQRIISFEKHFGGIAISRHCMEELIASVSWTSHFEKKRKIVQSELREEP